MNSALFLPLLLVLVAQAPEDSDKDPAARTLHAKLSKIYRQEAQSYTFYRDSQRNERLELEPEPVYHWTNPLRSGGQDGEIFVWTYLGRAEVVGCVFSNPAVGPRRLNHEFHSLSLSTLEVDHSEPRNWVPEAPGIDLKPIPNAPVPAGSPKQRLVQMRALIRSFTASTRDKQEKRWELRTLAHPLYRYASRDPDVLDGAVFAFVTSSGTDPEALVVIEARRSEQSKGFVWQYGVARFTDLDLWVRLSNNEVYVVDRVIFNSVRQDPKNRYRAFHDRDIPPVEDQTP